MRIKSISYINHQTGWSVRDLHLDYLTLLVGASGVGKTKIIRSIIDLSRIARGNSYNGIEWKVKFQQNGADYEWSGQFEVVREDDISFFDSREKNYAIKFEKLVSEDQIIVDRQAENIIFNKERTVKLDTTKSIIELLKEENEIRPVYDAFGQVFMLDNENQGIRISPSISEKRDQIRDAITVHNSRLLSPVEKLFVLRKNGLTEFDKIKSLFIEIFPLVEDIDFTLEKLFNDTMYPVLKIKERGVSSWILQHEISSGMYRTLSQITIMVLAQDGDVILIDEFENGLGVNCIDKLAQQIIDPERTIQTIITSHHPYIINNIPFVRWKIVTRENSQVNVLSASDLKIGEHSKHDAFMQLIQTAEFKTGKR